MKHPYHFFFFCKQLPVSANTVGIEKLMTMMKVYTLHPDETKENKKLARVLFIYLFDVVFAL